MFMCTENANMNSILLIVYHVTLYATLNALVQQERIYGPQIELDGRMKAVLKINTQEKKKNIYIYIVSNLLEHFQKMLHQQYVILLFGDCWPYIICAEAVCECNVMADEYFMKWWRDRIIHCVAYQMLHRHTTQHTLSCVVVMRIRLLYIRVLYIGPWPIIYYVYSSLWLELRYSANFMCDLMGVWVIYSVRNMCRKRRRLRLFMVNDLFRYFW